MKRGQEQSPPPTPPQKKRKEKERKENRKDQFLENIKGVLKATLEYQYEHCFPLAVSKLKNQSCQTHTWPVCSVILTFQLPAQSLSGHTSKVQ